MSSSTLLSDVAFIRNLAGNSTLHRTVVSVLEGQLITVMVILSFILVILVRDYVIQQQPDLNMRAAFPENPAQMDHVHENGPPNQAPNLRGPDDSDSDDETLDDGGQGHEDDYPESAPISIPSGVQEVAAQSDPLRLQLLPDLVQTLRLQHHLIPIHLRASQRKMLPKRNSLAR